MVRFPKEPYLMLPWVFILHAGYPPVYRVPHALGVLALVAAFLAVVLAAAFLAAGNSHAFTFHMFGFLAVSFPVFRLEAFVSVVFALRGRGVGTEK